MYSQTKKLVQNHCTILHFGIVLFNSKFTGNPKVEIFVSVLLNS